MKKRTENEPEEIGFADAMEELNTIVAELETDDVDVDVMAERVERAAFLVSMCRERLDSTRYRVEEIIVGLDTNSDGADSDGSDSNGADGDGSDVDAETAPKD